MQRQGSKYGDFGRYIVARHRLTEQHAAIQRSGGAKDPAELNWNLGNHGEIWKNWNSKSGKSLMNTFQSKQCKHLGSAHWKIVFWDSLGSFLAPFPVLILRGESWIAWHRMHDVERRSGVACSMPVRNIVLSCSCRCVGQKHARCILRYFQSSSPITPQEYQDIDISSSTIDSMSMRFEVYLRFPIFGF